MTGPLWANTYCLHTWPLDDLLEHELSPTCPCAPGEEPYMQQGEKWFLYVHSSLDGRELTEPATVNT
jgi:hypothetical protein